MNKRDRLLNEVLAMRKDLTKQFNEALENGQPTAEIEQLRSKTAMLYFKLNRK